MLRLLLGQLLLLVALVSGQQGLESCSRLLSVNSHINSVWRATLNIPVKSNVTRWQATLKFSRPVTEFTTKSATSSSADKRGFVLRGGSLVANSVLSLNFEAKYAGPSSTLTIDSVHFDGSLVCNVTDTSNPTIQRIQTPVQQAAKGSRRLKYDYASVIHKSLLFYEAQRSGYLPIDNRIPWRGDSCISDSGNRREDLSGGYYTNGRTLKFTFPTAAAMTVLAWGILNHEDGYNRADELIFAKDALYWGTSYLERCHTRPDELYALVGNVTKEIQEWWGRPEDINFNRPAYSVTPINPGSELAAETAAALAASSIVLDEKHRQSHLKHAEQLYNFAVDYRGDYSKAVPQVVDFYRSWSGEEDELVWAALWLFRATNQDKYLNDAKNMYRSFQLSSRKVTEFSWDEKTLGVRVLLAAFTLDEQYATDAQRVCQSLIGNSTLRNPQGLFQIDGQTVGAIRYAANLAFTCFELGEFLVENNGLPSNPYLPFAIEQVNFVLGDSGRSYMVGFGNNYPVKVQHSASSCSKIPQECGWRNKNAAGPNPQVLTGALVGGPDKNGVYEDSRDNWYQNDVGIDYNAGFQSLVAALLEQHHKNGLPSDAYLTGRY